MSCDVSESVQPPRVPDFCPPRFSVKYRVGSGETMWGIARLFQISVEGLAAANPHISNPARIVPGDVLCVPEPVPPPPDMPVRRPEVCPAGFNIRFEVAQGETMWSIARTFEVSLSDLIRANPHIENPDVLFPGDVLCVPS